MTAKRGRPRKDAGAGKVAGATERAAAFRARLKAEGGTRKTFTLTNEHVLNFEYIFNECPFVKSETRAIGASLRVTRRVIEKLDYLRSVGDEVVDEFVNEVDSCFELGQQDEDATVKRGRPRKDAATGDLAGSTERTATFRARLKDKGGMRKTFTLPAGPLDDLSYIVAKHQHGETRAVRASLAVTVLAIDHFDALRSVNDSVIEELMKDVGLSLGL